MNKERGFFRRHKVISTALVIGAWKAARRWKEELKKLPYQGPDNRMYDSPRDNPDEFEHMRARPTNVSANVPKPQKEAEDKASESKNVTDEPIDSSSLFGPGGLNAFMNQDSSRSLELP